MDNETEDAATQALVRDVGRRSVEQLGEGVTRMIGETSALTRWLLTMLVALNGAALWHCLIRTEPLGSAPALFFAGAMAAILAAIVGLVVALPATGAMRAAIAVWTEVTASGTLSDEALAAARRVRRMGLVWMAAVALCALVSLGLFLAGALAVSGKLAATPAPAAAEAVPGSAPLNAAVSPDNGAEAANEVQPSPGHAKAAQTPSPAASPAARPHRPAQQAQMRSPRPSPSAMPHRAGEALPSPPPAAMSPPPLLPIAPTPSAPPPDPSPSLGGAGA